jgi:hypothetical protein
MPRFSYSLICFFFNKIREQEDGKGSAQRLGEGWGVGGPNNVYMCINKCKNDKIK